MSYFELPNAVAEINACGGRKTTTLPPYLGVIQGKSCVVRRSASTKGDASSVVA
jgi:hypothetical protein